MARRANRRKKASIAAIPTYREDSKKTSGPDPKLAIIALLLVVLLIGSGLYLTSIIEEAPEVSYGVEASLLTDNHKTQPGYDTDFVIIVQNTGSITDTFDISVKSNDGGFTIGIEDDFESVIINKDKRKPIIVNVDTSESSTGLLYAYIEIKSRGDPTQTSDIKLNVDTDYTFGNQTSRGDSVSAHYGGILASDAKLFDTSMNYILDNYKYYNTGVSDSRNPAGDGQQGRGSCSDNKYKKEHECSSNGNIWTIPPLNAANIGCDGQGIPTEECNGSRQMIPGFDAKMVGMYEGQTLSVRIPAKDAYGEAGVSTSDLAGEDLIFIIEMVSVD